MAWDIEEWARRVMEADTDADAEVEPSDSQRRDSAESSPGRLWVILDDGTVNTAIPVDMVCYLKWKRVNTDSWELVIVTVDGEEHRQCYDSEDRLLRLVLSIATMR